MEFKIGQKIKVLRRPIYGVEEFEVMRAGAKYYLFNEASGRDWMVSKTELIQAIQKYENTLKP